MKYGEGEDPKSSAPSKSLSADTMRRYNSIINFAKAKKYAGNPQLDHDENLRKRIWDEHNKANPNLALEYSPNLVKDIQGEIQRYRAQALAAIQKNNGLMDKGTTPQNFMSSISQEDGLWGQKTSQWQFPEAYVIEKGEKKSLGFAPKVDMLAALRSAKR